MPQVWPQVLARHPIVLTKDQQATVKDNHYKMHGIPLWTQIVGIPGRRHTFRDNEENA